MDPTLVAVKAAVPAARHLSKGRRLPIVRGKVLTHHLRSLEPGDSIDRFARSLGPPRSSRRYGSYVHHTFDLKIATVLAITDVDDATVRAYQVNRLTRRYRPKIMLTPRSSQPLKVRLGKTTYAEARSASDTIDAFLGANWFAYQELHYHGRPGRYWHYTLRTDISAAEPLFDFLHSLNTPGSTAAGDLHALARKNTVIDGYGVSEDGLDFLRDAGLFTSPSDVVT